MRLKVRITSGPAEYLHEEFFVDAPDPKPEDDPHGVAEEHLAGSIYEHVKTKFTTERMPLDDGERR